MTEALETSKVNQFATFHVGEMLFGIDVHSVQEIIRFQKLTRVPLAPDVVRGLINLRGQIITAVDLRKRLALSDVESDESRMNIVVKVGEEKVSLLVDAVGDVIEVSQTVFESAPSSISGSLRGVVRGVYKLSDKLMLVLDTDKAVAV